MKGIILHGGSGTRLRPLTYTDVKQLLPIAGKPISEYALENLIEIGIKNINIVIGSVGGLEVKKFYGDGSRWNVNISYTYQPEPLGIAHAIGLTKAFVGNDDFVVFLGDNYLQNGISNLYEDFTNAGSDGHLGLVPVDNPSQFGIAEVDNGKISKLVEKPKTPTSNLAIVGVYFLTPKVFESIDRLKPSKRGEYEITEAYQDMIDRGLKISYSIISGWFKDTGTVDDFLACNRLILDKLGDNGRRDNVSGRFDIHPTVKISSDSEVVGPCFIGEGTRIEHSYIGPYTSIGSNCIIKNAEIEDSIIMDGCEIDLLNENRIKKSLLGPNVRVVSGSKYGMRLVLGRDSKLEL
ncbi:glucose-1-phosphate thymidylyltransferase [Thermoplasma volcanium]|nr:glucose-1-phosphate thymidylyltransferase [Thermoplasma volcanium]